MKPICRECEYMKLLGRARRTANNAYIGGPRGICHCAHPKACDTFYRICPRSPRMAGFIGFASPGEYVPQLKTSPKWCPKKYEEN